MESKGAEGKAEGDVINGVWFGGGGCLSGGNGNFDLLGHDDVELADGCIEDKK